MGSVVSCSSCCWQALADRLHQRQPSDSCDERSPLLPGGWKTNDSLTCDSPVDPDNPVTLDHSDYPDIILSSSAASTLSRSERLGCGQGHKLALDTSEEDSLAYSNSGEQKHTVFSLDLGVTLESTPPGSIKPILQIGSAETDTEQQDGGMGRRSPRDKALGSHKPPGLCVEKYGSGEHEDSCTCNAHPPSVDSAHVGCSSVSVIHAVLCSPSAKPSPPQGMKADSTKDILNGLRVWPPGIAPDRRLETFDSGVGSPGGGKPACCLLCLNRLKLQPVLFHFSQVFGFLTAVVKMCLGVNQQDSNHHKEMCICL